MKKYFFTLIFLTSIHYMYAMHDSINSQDALVIVLENIVRANRIIDFSHNNLTSDDIANLLYVINGFNKNIINQINYISLEHHTINSEATQNLVQLIKNAPSLELLDLSYTKLTFSNLTLICKAVQEHKQQQKFRWLGLQNLLLEKHSTKALAQLCLSYPKLTISANTYIEDSFLKKTLREKKPGNQNLI